MISVLSTPQIKISLENSELIEDFEYVAKCTVSNFQGDFSIEWLLNDQQLAYNVRAKKKNELSEIFNISFLLHRTILRSNSKLHRNTIRRILNAV
jgi:hypothetical protein